MKIPKINIPPVNPYKASEIKIQQSTQKYKQQADKLEISSEAKHLSEASPHSIERNEKVQAIQTQIEAGTYKVNPEKLAGSLLNYYNK